MKSLKFLLIISLCYTAAFAQTETFDIVTYQPIPGWKKQVTDYAVSFSIVDNVSGSWSQLGVYKSLPGNNNASGDFSNEWKSLVKTDTYVGATEPKPSQRTEDGWTYSYGVSPFKWQSKDASVSLLTISGYNLMLSVFISGNSTKYNNDVDKFLKSIQLKKPEAKISYNQQPISNGESTNNVAEGADVSGITISTTNFDDGWSARPYSDYVKVSKQSNHVMLHYAFKIDDEMRNGEMSVVVWNRLLSSRYRTNNLKVYKNDSYTYFRIYFVEAEAVEVATNKPCYVGLRVLVDNGVARPVEVVSPNAAEFQKEFADQKKIEGMVNYNKFAVSPKDIVGTWEESTSTAINLYNTYTGGYAGMNTSAMASKFVFSSNGSYHSEHKGAYGMTGSLKFYDEKYDGKYMVATWESTMTNRFKGETNNYWCQYEAVKGGRVLHLMDKEKSGMTFHLVKTK